MTVPPSGAITAKPAPEMLMAEALYRRDLPDLLGTAFGQWVAYTAQGRIAQGGDELLLFEECLRRGLQRGQFLVARIEPDAPTAQITDNWFPLDPSTDTDNAVIREGP
jgi:hypothetical protein